jgi:hypothetical protein
MASRRGSISLSEKLRARLQGVPRPGDLEPSFALLGDLRRLGWYESFKRGPTMGGEHIPWLTYPAFFWLSSVCSGIGSVFEFGGGNSTLWWANRSKRVVAVEHNQTWVRRISAARLSNVQVHHTQLADYAGILAESEEQFEVIVIDGGLDRNACAAPALDHLGKDGLIIFDDTHLDHHSDGVALLHDAGLRRIDFIGPRPGARFIEATSVFSHDLNRWGATNGVPVFEWAFS